MFTFCGEGKYKPVGLEELSNVAPEPKGPRHVPIAHKRLVESVLDGCYRVLKVPYRNLQLYRSECGARLIGAVDLPGYLDTPDLPYVPSLFFWHSNDQRHALILGAGGKVAVCQNGMLSCTFASRRKHTSGLRLRSHVDAAIERAGELVHRQHSEVERLRSEGFHAHPQGNKVLGEARLMRMFVRGHLPGNVAREAHKTWTEPCKVPDFSPGSRWHWYNMVTGAVKRVQSLGSQATLLERAWKEALS